MAAEAGDGARHVCAQQFDPRHEPRAASHVSSPAPRSGPARLCLPDLLNTYECGSSARGRGFRGVNNLGSRGVLEFRFRNKGQTIRGSQASRRFISSGKNNPWLLGDLNPGA